MTSPEERAKELRAQRVAPINHIRVLLEKLGGNLSMDREGKLYEMRLSELEKLGVTLMGVATFRGAVAMLVTAIVASERIQLASN